MSDDPFSAILSLVDAQAACGGGFIAGGSWALAFPPPRTIKFFVVVHGHCWLAPEGGQPPFRMGPGDVLLLTAARPFVIASELGLTPLDAHAMFPDGRPAMLNLKDFGCGSGGDDVLFIGGHVDLAASGRLLVDSLPPAIHITGDEDAAPKLQWLIRQLAEEYNLSQSGGDFACAALAQLIFLQILRAYLAREGEMEPGWLRAMTDTRLAPALRLMHGEPARNWSLPELARAAAMSRTAFAVRFKTTAGMAPLTYLTRWRMRLAERWLVEGRMPIAQIARGVGFSSDAAFSNAFKRVTGNAPSQYRSMALVAAR